MRTLSTATLSAALLACLASPARAQPSMTTGGIIRDAGTPYTLARETQGKTFFVDGTWWGVFGGTSGLDFYKFDKTTSSWSKATFPGSHVTSDTVSRADCHWDGANLSVLFSTNMSPGKGNLNLAVYSYTRPSFAIYSGFPVFVYGSNAVDKNWSITTDSNARLWISYQTTSTYGVISSKGTGVGGWGSFNAPITMGDASTGIDNDLGSHGLVAFAGKIGLMWTECFSYPNNHMKFRWRSDSNTDLSASAWGAVELCQEDGTLLLTDDHVCVRSFEGQVWCISKTEYSADDGGKPRFTLMRRDTSGRWSHWTVKTIGPTPDYSTRPIIILDATNRLVYCFWHNSGNQYNTTPIDNPGTFSSVQTAIKDTANCTWDTGGPQQACDATSGMMVIADRNCDGWTMFRLLSLGTPTTGPLASITVTPNPASTTTGGQVSFTATGRDASGNTVSFTPSWSATGGTITSAGVYTAGSSAGTFSVTATSGSISGSATVNVTTAPTPTLTSIVVTPNPASTTTGGTVQFSAQAKDQNGDNMTATFSWTASAGSISQTGLYTAPATTGTYDIAATSSAVTGHASVTVSPPPPPTTETIVDNDTAGFSVLSGTWKIHFTTYYYGINCRTLDSGAGSCKWAAALAAGTYDVYAWWPSRGSSTNARPTYTIHTSQGDASVTKDQTISTTWGTWNKLGSYPLDASASVTITGASGTYPAADAIRFVLTSSSYTPILTTITVAPNPVTLQAGATQTFTAQGKDQNGQPMSATFAWSATAGTIDANGNYTAGNTAGTFSVTATSGSVSGSATVNVTTPTQVLTTIVVSPNPANTTPSGMIDFTAQAKDQNGNLMSAELLWGASAGTIDATGHYTAPNATGTADVSASSQGVVGHATVNIVAPTSDVIVDNTDAGWTVVSGSWKTHFNPYRYGVSNTGIVTGTTGECQWRPVLASGTYDVYVWTPGQAAPCVAQFNVITANGTVTLSLDQSQSSLWGVWTKLGNYKLDGGTASVHLVANTGQNVVGDAVRFVQTGP